MIRLLSITALWLLLLFAAAPASGVMSVQPRNCTWEETANGYDVALDVRDGPNLYAYVQQNPWTAFDPDGLTGWGVHFPNATSSNSMTNNKEYRNSYMQTAGKGMLVGAVGVMAATGVAQVAAPVLGTGFVSAAVSNGIGGYVANGVSNKLEGGNFNDNAGTAIVVGAGTGVVLHGLMRGSAPGENPQGGKTPAQPEANNGTTSPKPATTTPGGKTAQQTQAENITLYRGVPADHDVPAIREAALRGEAIPRGGSSTPAQHNGGLTDSEFTSWTTNESVARTYGANGGPGGSLLKKTVPKSEVIKSPDSFRESEVLLKGKVKADSVERLR